MFTVFILLVLVIILFTWAYRNSAFYQRKEQEQRRKCLEEQEIIRQERLRADRVFRKKQERKQQKELEEKLAASKENLAKNMDAAFQKIPGWNIWDESIHHYHGQTDRMMRTDEVSVIAYDPVYAVAKIKGSSGNYYLTKADGCSCMDFKKRGLPCKRMYALALHLCDGLSIPDDPENGQSLYGLTFALAGHFAGNTNDPNGIRARINSRKGIWTSTLRKDISALVCGVNPSESKRIFAKENRIMIISEEEVGSIFSKPNESLGVS